MFNTQGWVSIADAFGKEIFGTHYVKFLNYELSKKWPNGCPFK